MKIGFIGTGIMGSRMAANLLKNNFDVAVYNRTRQKADPLIEKGAEWRRSPAELAANIDVLFTMLGNPDAVQQTALGENGFLTALAPEKIWVDCSTVNPSFSREMAENAKKKGIGFLDAPVLGTKTPAENGELLFVVGGDAKYLERCRPMLEVMGKKIIHTGENGMGTSMKMVLNLLLGQSMLAFSEAMVLGESLGFSREVLFGTILGGPVAAPFLSGKQHKIVKEDYLPDFPLKWMHKDLQLVSQTGYENGTALPLTNIAKEIYALAKKQGFGEKDFSAIYKFLSVRKSIAE